MVYKYHQKWRDSHPVDSSIWDDFDFSKEVQKQVHNMRRSKPVIPYTLEIECNSYWGNFERAFIGFSMGILDDVQMGINHSEEERTMFWKEVFDKEPIADYEQAAESYELLKDYLLETFQSCDDWEQLTFYQIDWDIMHKENRNVLMIQLAKPLNEYWEGIVIPRMKDFFSDRPYKYMSKDTKLLGIRLLGRKGNVVKEY